MEKKWLLRALLGVPPLLLLLLFRVGARSRRAAAAERRQELTSLSCRREDGRPEATDEEESDGEEAMRFSHLLLL